MPLSIRSPAARQLAERMLELLRSKREFNSDGYMLSLEELVDEANSAADEQTVKQVLRSKAFPQHFVMADPKDRSAPVALKEDLEKLAASPRLLEYVKARLQPPYSLPGLKKQLNSKLRKPFEQALKHRIQTGEVDDVSLRPIDPHDQLAIKLVKVLESQKRLGRDAYPLSLRRLAELTEIANPDAEKKRIFAATGKGSFRNKAVAVQNKQLDAPVALAVDAELLGQADETLRYMLRALRSKTIHARTVAQLAGKVTGSLKERVRTAFKDRWNHASGLEDLADGVAWVCDRKPKFFLLEDLHLPRDSRRPAAAETGSSPVGKSSPTEREEVATVSDFAEAFAHCFDRLDAQGGGHNFVSLVDLRRELSGVPRQQFDEGLRQLRVEGRYTLGGAHSKHGITPDEREAGIEENGRLLVHVSRRT